VLTGADCSEFNLGDRLVGRDKATGRLFLPDPMFSVEVAWGKAPPGLSRARVVIVPLRPRRRLLGCALIAGVMKLPGLITEIGSKASAASVSPHSQSMSSFVRSGSFFGASRPN
jgi:hypothetical protein